MHGPSSPSETSPAPSLPGVASLGSGWTLDRYLLLEELDADDPLRGRTRRFAALDGKYLAEVQLTLVPAEGQEEARFLAEADLARQQESPFLPQVLRAGTAGSVQFLSASWSPTVGLRSVLQALSGMIRPDLAARVLWTTVAALSRLHGRGLAHGDLRPRHLRFTAEGNLRLEGYVPTRHQGEAPQESGVRQAYLPPEWHHHGVRSMPGDVYAVGLLAYELLAGRHLLAKGEDWQPRERQAMLEQQLEKAGYRLPVPSYPQLAPFLGAMLRMDPAARPPTTVALGPGFEEALGGAAVQRPVAELAVPSLLHAMSRQRGRLLGLARDALERELPLAAASSLRRAAGLRVEPGAYEARAARDLLLELLWGALPGAANPDDPAASLRATALCLLAYRASRELQEGELGTLARRLASAWSEPGGPLQNLVLPPPGADDAAAERSQYLARLHYDPGDEGALLGLASLETVAESPRPGLSPSLRKARLCRQHRAHAAALFHLAQDLRADRDPPGTLARMARWLADAAPAEAPPASTAPPSPSTPEILPSQAPEPPRASAELAAEEVQRSLEELDRHLTRGELTEAARGLSDLQARGATRDDQHYSALVGRVWRFLWAALLPAPASMRKDLALLAIHRVAQDLGLESVLPLCERLLVRSIPEDERVVRIPEILAEAPRSLPLVQAASRLAVTIGDQASFVEQLLAAGESFLELGEMRLASQMFMAVKAEDPDSLEVREGMDQVLALGERMAEAAERFKQVEAMVAQASMPATALINVRGFLKLYPFYEPALELAARLYAEDGKHQDAARIHVELATRALWREEDLVATKHLHKVLTLDLENDQALMMLASIRPPGYDAPKEVWKLRISILEREELWDAAVYHARKQLRGGAGDFQVLAMIVGLCRKAQRDPSPHLLAQGYLALDQGDPQLARDCFDEAIEQAPDRNGTIDLLLTRAGIEVAFTHQELLLKKH